MQVTERAAFLNLAGDGSRSKGVHVTDILSEVARRLGVLKPQDEDEDLELLLLKYSLAQPGDIPVFNRIAAGLAWEDWLGRQMPGLLYHFGEVSADGIAGTPDGYMLETNEVYELKYTWKTANQDRRPIEHEWLWIKQLQAYCYLMNTLCGVLHVFYCNGDYKGSGPLYRIWNFDFEQQEVDGVWKMITGSRYLVETP